MNGSGRNVAGCASCKGECCRRYKVEISVFDMRVLSSGTDLDPVEFVRLLEDESGFSLRPGGPKYSLYLKRHEKNEGCVFLMEIGPGHARCGVYAHRPLVCSNFPASLSKDTVQIRQDTLCGPDSWNLAAMDLTGYRRDLVRSRAEWGRHLRIVDAWNTAMEIKGRAATSRDLLEWLNSPERTDKALKALERRREREAAAKEAAEKGLPDVPDVLEDDDEDEAAVPVRQVAAVGAGRALPGDPAGPQAVPQAGPPAAAPGRAAPAARAGKAAAAPKSPRKTAQRAARKTGDATAETPGGTAAETAGGATPEAPSSGTTA